MKYLFFLMILTINSVFASDVEVITNTELVREERHICDDKTYDSMRELFPETPAMRITDLIDGMNQELSMRNRFQEKVTHVTIKSCGINDDRFAQIYFKFLSNSQLKNDVTVLDFSFNPIGRKSVPLIEKILDEFPQLLFMSLAGSLLSTDNIGELVVPIMDNASDKSFAMKKIEKIIFMNDTYISHAQDQEEYYQEMVSKGYLPSNWAELHRFFHKNHNHETERLALRLSKFDVTQRQ